MNIYEATLSASTNPLIIRKRNKNESYWFKVTAGGIYRNKNGVEIGLNAKDCMSNDWYLVDKKGAEVAT
jgi:hypothetical protein